MCSSTRVACKAFVGHLNRARSAVHPSVFWFNTQEGNTGVEVALQWNDSYQETTRGRL